MKKILLVVEYIGKENFELSDEKIRLYVHRYSDDAEIHLYCKECIMNEAGDYVRSKGVQIHTAENGSIVYAPKDYDHIITYDEWANHNIAMFKAENVSSFETASFTPKIEENGNQDKNRYDIKGKKIADIIIPHHNRHDHLFECLKRLPNDIFYIHIESGGSFAENCNEGAKHAKTDNLIFLNDDTEPDANLLIEMCKNPADLMGATQVIPTEGQEIFYGISFYNDRGIFEPRLTKNKDEVVIPTGFLLRFKKKAWDDLGGFDEKFVNGGEDTDIALRALEMKMTIDYMNTPIIHKNGQSHQRFIAFKENQKYLDEKWPEKKIKALIKDDRKRVLLATNHLDRLGGSETWTYTMAKEFERRGWKVEVFTMQNGDIADKLPIVEAPTGEYDLILINHTTCLEALKDAKGKKIFTSHGIYPAIEQPQEGADAYVAISEEVQKNMKEKGFEAEVIRNGIDCDRFKPKKKINKTPKRVLCMCQGEEAKNNVKKACEELGLEYDDTFERVWNVEDKINAADIVITLGRGAYEAMACGRAVIIYDSRPYSPFKTADGIVTRSNAKKLATHNFSGRTNKLNWLVGEIKREIKKYKPVMGEDNRKIALASFNVKKQVEKYINL